MLKKKKKFSPIISFLLLTAIVICLSGLLSLFNVQVEYSTVNKANYDLMNNVVGINNLFSLSGLKFVFTNAVSNFVGFEPLATIIIVLIGIGVLEKSGFLKTCFTILAKNTRKNTVTFILIFISLLLSLVGNIGFAIMLPIGALLFKYAKRNPLGGIIATFAALSFGTGINIFLSATDSSLLSLTLLAAKSIDVDYTIGIFFSLFIMILVLISTSIIFTNVTEKKIMPKLPRVDAEEIKEVVITNKELRGLIIGLGAGVIYLLLIIYQIIPGLPLSGGLLDHSATKYIDMLFGAKSLFNQGFIFIVTVFFIIIGLGYGLMAKTIKNGKDVTDSLGYSLDGIGNILVLMFFASLFVNVYEESNIGQVITAWSSNLIGGLNLSGIALILVTMLLLTITNLFYTNPVSKWTILSASVITVFMNASISPEFTQIVFTATDSITNGLTPLFVYFVVYLAFLEKYNIKDEIMSLSNGSKFMLPYSIYVAIIWFVIIIGWYLIGLPIGIGSLPGVVYGA